MQHEVHISWHDQNFTAFLRKATCVPSLVGSLFWSWTSLKFKDLGRNRVQSFLFSFMNPYSVDFNLTKCLNLCKVSLKQTGLFTRLKCSLCWIRVPVSAFPSSIHSLQTFSKAHRLVLNIENPLFIFFSPRLSHAAEFCSSAVHRSAERKATTACPLWDGGCLERLKTDHLWTYKYYEKVFH